MLGVSEFSVSGCFRYKIVPLKFQHVSATCRRFRRMYSFRALQALTGACPWHPLASLGIPWHQGAELPELSPRTAGPRGARQSPEGGAPPS